MYEVPFIAFYRKEHVESILMCDLWKIYLYDEKVFFLFIIDFEMIFSGVVYNKERSEYMSY